MTLNPPRRDVLRMGSAIAAVVTTAGLSGCVGGLLGGGSDSSMAIETVRQWAPARATISEVVDEPLEHYGLTYAEFEALAAANERLDRDLFEGVTVRFEDRFGVFDVSPGDVRFRLYNGYGDVLRWDHDSPEIGAVLDDAGFRQVAKHRGFRVFASGDETSDADDLRVFALDGTHLIHTNSRRLKTGAAIDGLERFIETHTGERERFADESPTITGLLERANGGDVLSISRLESLPTSDPVPKFGYFEGLSGRCLCGRFDGDRFQRQDLFQFRTRDAVDMDAIKTYVEALEDDEERFGQATKTTVDRESRLVEVTWASTLESPD